MSLYAIKRGNHWLTQSQTWVRWVTAKARPTLALFKADKVCAAIEAWPSHPSGFRVYSYDVNRPASQWTLIPLALFENTPVKPPGIPIPKAIETELERAMFHADMAKKALYRAQQAAINSREEFAILVLTDLQGQAHHLAAGVGLAHDASRNGGAK